jgi:hypothetical protein
LNTATVDSPRPASQFRSNPVFWIMWLLPASAVLGGLVTLAIALRSADRALPAAYHWEGEQLDRDFERARNAAAHGTEVGFTLTAGECAAIVRSAPTDSTSLTLLFTHGADAGLDRVVLLNRVAPGEYRGACATIPAGRWRVTLEDAAATWSIRAQANGAVDALTLRARK